MFWIFHIILLQWNIGSPYPSTLTRIFQWSSDWSRLYRQNENNIRCVNFSLVWQRLCWHLGPRSFYEVQDPWCNFDARGEGGWAVYLQSFFIAPDIQRKRPWLLEALREALVSTAQSLVKLKWTVGSYIKVEKFICLGVGRTTGCAE